MNNRVKRNTLYMILTGLVGVLASLLSYLFIDGSANYGMLVMLLCIVTMLLIIVVWFQIKFRINIDEYDFNVTEYRKDRADIEEKIRELQNMINHNDASWVDNNHLVLAGQEANDLLTTGKVLEKQFGITSECHIIDDQAFMLMPFNREAFKIYAQCRTTAARLKINLKKSDDDFVEGDLLKSIVEQIVRSAIIIANLDGKNPNVFYELGIAHALGKKTILITSYEPENMPFDVKGKFIIFYQSMEELDQKLENALKSALNIKK